MLQLVKVTVKRADIVARLIITAHSRHQKSSLKINRYPTHMVFQVYMTRFFGNHN